MTSTISKPCSTVKPLSAHERAAWAAHNAAEERERLSRVRRMSLADRLRELEEMSRFLNTIRERHLARNATKR